MLGQLAKLQSSRCCFLNKVSEMQQQDWKGEDSSCSLTESIFLYNNLKALESSMLLSQNSQAEWDLGDLVFTPPQVFVVEVLEDSSQLLYVEPASYASVNALIQAIVDSVNAQGKFTASSSGVVISITSTDPDTIGLTLTLNIITPYEIKNRTVVGSFIYSTALNPALIGLANAYNEFDGLLWCYGESAGPLAVVSFTDINTLTEVDFQSYILNTFTPSAVPAPILNKFNKKMYCGGYNGAQFYVTGIDADPVSTSYKVQVTEIQPLDSTSVLKASFFNEYNNLLYLKMLNNAGAPYIIILDGNDITQASLPLTNDAAHSLLGTNRPFYSDYDRNTGNVYLTTNETIIVIDGEPSSPNYNTVIAEYTSPKAGTHWFSSILWLNGKFIVALYDSTSSPTPVTEYVYEMDTVGNFVEAIASPGIFNINIANGYIAVNFRDVVNPTSGALNKVVLYDFSYNQVSEIPTGIATYYTSSAEQADQTRLNYLIEGTNFLSVLESDTQSFTYNLTFAPPSANTNPCFSTAQQNAVINNLLDKCGCGSPSTVGSFGDSTNVLGDGNGNAIDANSNYIQV